MNRKGWGLALLALVVAISPAVARNGTTRAPLELDRVQEEIAGYKHLKAAEVTGLGELFGRLVLQYIQAYGPLVQDGGEFSVINGDAWEKSEGPRAAFKRRLERDMRQWHPIFALTFVESVIGAPPWTVYAVMLHLQGDTAEAAVDRRKAERARELEESGYAREYATSVADREILDQAVRQNEVFREVIEENLVRIFVESLHVDPVSSRLNAIERVSRVIEVIDAETRYEGLSERIRYGGGSHTLPEAIHEIAGKILVRQDLDASVKHRRFSRLLDLFVVLQNEESRDHLLLLFEGFDGFDRLLEDTAPFFDRTLNERTAAFILTSLGRDPEGRLGLDVLDQLTRWILRLVPLNEGLRNERVVDVLLMLRVQRPSLLEDYIRRFYSDFHAFNPAGYETVVLHLVSILVRYAEMNVFLPPDPRLNQGPPSDPDAGLAPHEKVMETLRWYDSALWKLAGTLPEIDVDFVEAKQRAVLDKIYGYFRDNTNDLRPHGGRVPDTFLETLLQLTKRVVRTADPEDLYEYVLKPFARARGFDDDPLLFWSERRVTRAMELHLAEIAVLVAVERRR